MTEIEQPDPIILVHELAGTRCRCGKTKRGGETFCRSCYYRLPPPYRRALYALLGDGYEEAYAAAVGVLDAPAG